MAKRARTSRSSETDWVLRIGEICLWALLFAVPFVLVPTARDAFRLPKLVLSEALVLASLCCLVLRSDKIRDKAIWRSTVVRAALPLALAAGVGGLVTAHGLHFREGFASFAVGIAALVGWTLLIPEARLRRLLDISVVPACLTAVLGVLQAVGVQPLQFVSSVQIDRLGITALAGNPGDLSAYLLLPFLLVQHALASGRRRVHWWVALVLLAAALLATQTLTSLIAVAVASLVLWARVLDRKRLIVAAVVALVLGGLAASVGPLAGRVADKVKQVAKGDLNRVLTGRLDGWNAAVWMLGESPLVGVGHGAYRAEFAVAKLALVEEGVEFLPSQHQPIFANAHNEFLEVAAEWGLLGVVALAWALWLLVGAVRGMARLPDSGRGPPGILAGSGLIGLVVLSLAFFPLRIALTAYPAILFLAWIFRSQIEAPSDEAAS